MMTLEEAITILQEKYDYCKSFYDLAAHPEEDYPEMAKYLQALQIALQPTLIPPNEWVSVDERLPEYNPGTGAKSYWGAKKDNAGNWKIKIAQYCDYGYAMTVDAETEVTWRDWDFTKIVNVTHWMSLPKPPDRRPPEGEEDT